MWLGLPYSLEVISLASPPDCGPELTNRIRYHSGIFIFRRVRRLGRGHVSGSLQCNPTSLTHALRGTQSGSRDKSAAMQTDSPMATSYIDSTFRVI